RVSLMDYSTFNTGSSSGCDSAEENNEENLAKLACCCVREQT
ncbi:unnamed protein product, partial [marine sediment metagenome]